MIALADATFVKPHIEYGSLWPILVIFGAACVGVLIEAFLPREWRYLSQFAITLGSLVGVGFVAHGLPSLSGGTARGLFGSQGTIALDGPAMFLWGLLLVFGIGGVLLFAERRVEGGVSAFAGQAAALPGTESERRASGLDHTEVYPLLLFAIYMDSYPPAIAASGLFVGAHGAVWVLMHGLAGSEGTAEPLAR